MFFDIFGQVLLTDLGGWTGNDYLFKTLMKQRGNQFMSTIKNLMKEFPEDTKISDYEDLLCKEENGKVIDGFGKLIFELKIDEKNKEHQSRKEK